MEWSSCKLIDVCSVESSDLSLNDLEDDNGIYPLYGATGFLKNIDFFSRAESSIAIVKDGAGVGRTFICLDKSSILGTLQYILPLEGFDLYFVYYLLKNINFDKYIVGSTIPHIYFKDYSKEKISIPLLFEQKKIGSFLYNIDLKIDFIKSRIDMTIKFKKGLLERMFI